MEMNPLHTSMDEQQSSNPASLRNAYVSLLIVAPWIALFWPTVMATISIWSTSDTFAHGFVILPIIAWLFWRDREQFLRANLTGSYWGMIATIGFILLWIIGQLLEVSVFRQLGVFGAISTSFWMVFGDSFAKYYKFPLCYLIFAVPFGNGLIPLLQQITAEITVFMLQISQIPVFYEGLYITIPSGKFEVAVACSGIRYLIASLAVGALYAYLNYRYFHKQVLFIILSFVIPIIANGIRAYLIVIIAHMSDMKYATGADHLVYGWLFFGIVMLLMFYIGGLFADKEQAQGTLSVNPVFTKFNFFPTLIVVAFALTALLINRNIDAIEPPLEPELIKLSDELGMQPMKKSAWGIDFSNALAMYFGSNVNNVELYIAKFANRQTKGELLTSTNLFYDQQYWTLSAKRTGQESTTDGEFSYIELQLISAQGQHRLIRYSYGIDGKFIAGQAQVRLLQGVLALTNSSLPVHIIAISITHDSGSAGISYGQQQLSQWLGKHSLSLVNNGK